MISVFLFVHVLLWGGQQSYESQLAAGSTVVLAIYIS